jgi:hypothetical protein
MKALLTGYLHFNFVPRQCIILNIQLILASKIRRKKVKPDPGKKGLPFNGISA